MIVYKTTNKINGKFYVGKDTYDNDLYLGSDSEKKRTSESLKKKWQDPEFRKRVLEARRRIKS
jgi:hypothetical protein